MILSAIQDAVLAAVVLAIGVAAWFLTRPTCYMCQHCGNVHDSNDAKLHDSEVNNARITRMDLCPGCRAKATHDFPNQ